MPEQGSRCNIPYLKVSLEAIFSKMNQAKKKAFIFQQGNCKINVLHSCMLKSFALSICSRDPMKNSTQGYFLQEYLQPNKLQVATIMVLWKMITVFCSSSWNFSSPHYVACFVCQSLQIFVEKVTLWVMFHKISWKNINFCGLKKETFISNGRKI